MERFNLKAVLRLTGLNPDTIRAWEKRYEAVVPQRTETGRRMYSESEVHRLKLLAELSDLGHSIGTIARLPDSNLESILQKSKTHKPKLRKNSARPHSTVTDAILKAALRYDLPQLEILLSRANFALSRREILFQLIPELMYQVGEKVESGEMNIAQEHSLSELIRKVIRKIYDDLEVSDGTEPGGKILLFATPENHLHEFGVLMAAIVCRFHGFQTHYLGPNLPASALINAIRKIQPLAVVMGLSPASDSAARNPLMNYLKELDLNLPSSTQLWMGGAVPRLKKSQFKSKIEFFGSLDEFESSLMSTFKK